MLYDLTYRWDLKINKLREKEIRFVVMGGQLEEDGQKVQISSSKITKY